MNTYFEQKILHASPVELTRMVYQRAITSVRQAQEHMRHNRVAERARAVTRAYAAIGELISALRPELAPELAGRLQSLYLYTQRRLLAANQEQTDAPLAEALTVLLTLAEAWADVEHTPVREWEGSNMPHAAREATPYMMSA
jgi:flagellar protein FliS